MAVGKKSKSSGYMRRSRASSRVPYHAKQSLLGKNIKLQRVELNIMAVGKKKKSKSSGYLRRSRASSRVPYHAKQGLSSLMGKNIKL